MNVGPKLPHARTLRPPRSFQSFRSGLQMLYGITAVGLAQLAFQMQTPANAAEQAESNRLPRTNLLLYRAKSGTVAPVTGQAQWLEHRAEIIAGFCQIAGPLPDNRQLGVPSMHVQEEIDCGSYIRRLISYESEPGSSVPAYLLVPKAAFEQGQKLPVVLALHPTDMEYGHRVLVEPMRAHYRAYARDLVERGFVVLAPAYPLMANYQPDLKALGYQSGTMKAIWDNRRGLDLLESLPYVKRDGGFGALGHSLGGHNAIYTALFDERITALVTSCGFDSFLDYMDGKIQGWCSERYLPRLNEYRDRLADIPFDFHELLGALAPRRVFINAPLGDTNFKWRSVDEIVQAASAVYELYGKPLNLTVEHPDCGHDFPPESRERAYAVLASTLNPSPATAPESTPQKLAKVRIAKGGRTFTAGGKPYVPFGVNYYRPGTGWAPQVWKKFDLEATRGDFEKMKDLGVNCARVFLTYGSFYREPGILNEAGLKKLDQFLALAEETGIYVHPTGPDHWEGMPAWKPVAIEDESTLLALESFWRLLAARYKGRNVIFAYDLKNEPEVGWDSPTLLRKWNVWLEKKYNTIEKLAAAWEVEAPGAFGSIPPPADKDAPGSTQLLDYQLFREDVADEWTRRQAKAIKSADPDALVTVGLIQWSVPALLPGIRHYSGFRPERQAHFLDFMEIHFYPLADGAFEYRSPAELEANLSYLESIVREVAGTGKPVVLAEFGWYGGGKPKFGGGRHPEANEAQHAEYCRRAVETTIGYATGWLNWGFYDQPEATDCSELTGLLTASGEIKEWGKAFAELSAKYSGTYISPPPSAARPALDWDACLTSSAAAKAFREAYLKAFTPH